MSSSGSITPLPLDSELLGELLEKVPAEVIEQLTHNWRRQTQALARSQKENRLLWELLRLMRVEEKPPGTHNVGAPARGRMRALDPRLWATAWKSIAHLLVSDYLQADETPVGVQMHDGRGNNHQSYLWQYSQPGGVVIFDFQLSRAREGPKQFLANFNGILQTDGYSGYDRVGGPKLILTSFAWRKPTVTAVNPQQRAVQTTNTAIGNKKLAASEMLRS